MMEEEFDDINLDEEIDVKTLESWKVDRFIEKIKENNDDIKRYEEILKKRIEDLTH